MHQKKIPQRNLNMYIWTYKQAIINRTACYTTLVLFNKLKTTISISATLYQYNFLVCLYHALNSPNHLMVYYPVTVL